MNVSDERSRSYWMETAPVIDAPALNSNVECDVAIVGSGIAGLSTAYELARQGRSVVVIDRGGIGTGMTARTTAHLATELDDFYAELVKVRGEEEARLYHQSQVAAVNRIEAICRDENLDAGFRRLDGYLIPTGEGPVADLQKEFEACRSLGVEVEWCVRAPVPGLETGRCLRFPNQGRFHPTRYLAGLARAITARGGKLYANTAHVSDREVGGAVEIGTEMGATIRAGAAVFATNSPTNDKVAIHAKQVPSRTYVIAGRVPKGSVPDALIWDSLEAYHYVRLQPLNKSKDLLIVGGEDHRSGEADDMEDRFERLVAWAREHYPMFGEPEYRWSGQVMETVDFMPFSGRNPGSENVYIHTGDSGIGITHGVAGALTIADLILGRESRFAALFDPDRKPSASLPSLSEFASGVAGAVSVFTEFVRPGDVSSVKELKPGKGALVREGLKKIAAYRGQDGGLVRRSAACTHMGCVVQWNPFEGCWDCPCHGSQFAPDGQVLNGPATKPLADADA